MPKPLIKKFGAENYFFAAFAYLARHNVYLTLHAIDESIGRATKINDDAHITQFACLNVLENSTRSDEIEKVTIKLRQNFPFLKFIVPEKKNKDGSPITIDPKLYSAKLKLFFNALTDCRDNLSHAALHPNYYPTAEFIRDLRTIYDASWRRTKELLGKDSSMDHLLRQMGKPKAGQDKLEVQTDRNNFNFAFVTRQNKSLTEQGMYPSNKLPMSLE